MNTSLSSYNLETDQLNFISNDLSKGSASSYGYSWNKFAIFCSTLSIDPYTCNQSIVSKYLHEMFKRGLKYRTINNARSAISKFHQNSNIPMGQNPLIIKTMKAAFRLRPPLPAYKKTFDICPVLLYTKQIFGNDKLLNAKYISYKCLFLIAFSSLSRLSSLRSLGAAVEFHENFCIIPLMALEKQARG